MALTVQNLRAVGTGVEPAALLPGQICFNITDKILYVGDGSNVKTSFDGTQATGVPGEGWYSMPMDFASLGDYYVANPQFYGDTPTDQQVLTWSTALNHPIWTSGGGGGGNQVYITDNATVASASGATVSDKITTAIGVTSPDEGDVTIVTGLPDDVYEGLYFFTTEWIRGASYAYPSATEVIYDNTAHPDLTPTVQGAISDLDDGLTATTAIANTANSTATSALSIANAALPRAGGTMTGTIIARNIDIQTSSFLQFNGGADGQIFGITDSKVFSSSTTAASAKAVAETYALAAAALPVAGGIMTGPITFVAGQIFPVSGIQDATYIQKGVVRVGNNIDVLGGVISVKTATSANLGLVQTGTNIQNSAGVISVLTGSASQMGVLQVGTNLDVAAGVVSVADTSTTNKGVVQLNNTTNSTSVLQAATANAVKTTYDLANAAVPRSSYAADGDILVGTAPGTFGALGVGTEGQVLTVFGGVPAWTDDAPGDVTSVTGVAPILVDNTDPETPVVSVNAATTANLGVVQIDITGNINVAGGVITVPNASTTVRGAVQLNNTLSSGSTTEALTAAAGAALQTQINTLNLTNSVILAGGYDATTGLVDGVTAQGTAANFVDGAAPPVADATNVDHYLICTTAGTVPSAMENGDWLLSSETSPGVYAYVVLGVGSRPATASYTQAGVVQLADGAAVLAGTSDATAITPQALQDNVVDSVNTSNSNLIASATAVKTANDNALAAQSAAAAAQTTASAALPRAGGTMTGTLIAQDVNVQSGFAVQFAGGINGSLDGITDSTATTDNTIAASATAVKSAYDLANAALPRAGGTMTGDITLSGAGVGIVFDDASVVEAISDSTSTTSSVTAASSTAVKAAYDAGAAAIPCSVITAVGDIVVGGAGPAPTALPVGTDGQVLIANSACVAGLEWVTDVPGDVTSVAGTAPITVDNTDAQNPIVGIDAASTTQAGAVQLNDTVISTSTTEAATANAAKTAYDEAVVACGIAQTACGIAQAAVPCSSFTTTGDLLAGTGAGTYSALPAGTNGQVLLANSLCAEGLEWGNACYVPDACFTTKGQLIVGTGTGTYVALSPGTNGQLLVPNSACANGVEWVTCQGVSICGYTCTLTPFNTALGSGAGDSITSGTNNVALGVNALTAVTTTSLNVAVGSGSMAAATGAQNVSVGANALCSTLGSNNVAVGNNAGRAATAGSNNTFVGAASGQGIVGGGSNTVLGANALSSSSTGAGNTVIGSNAMAFGAGSTCNVAVGFEAGRLLAGASNTLVGCCAGSSITTGSCNVILGGYTGTATLARNVVLSDGVGAIRFQANSSGAWSPDGTNFGTIGQVLTSNGTVAAPTWCTLSLACVPCAAFLACGDLLVGTGSATFTALPTGTNSQVLTVDTTCTATGGLKWSTPNTLCGYTDTAALLNTALGFQAGDSITTGTDNVTIGYNAGTAITTGSQNVVIGSNTSVSSNAVGIVAVGFCAGQAVTTGGCVTHIGWVSGRNSTGASNTYVGALTGCAASNSSACGTLLGFCAGAALTTGNANTFLGFNSGRSSTTNTFNVAVGAAAFQSGTGSCNIAIGCGALSSSASGAANVAIGHRAMLNATSAANNVAIGLESGVQLSTGSNNTFVGHLTGDTVTTGTQNTFLGACSGGTVATTSEGNTAVGFSALGQGVTSGAYNVAVGNNAGLAVTSGATNTFVGFSAGSAVTTGGANTLIGRYAGTAALSNNIVLSDGAGTIRFQANSAGAWSPNGINFGTAGQVLKSAGTVGAPAWSSALYGAFSDSTIQTNTGGASGNPVDLNTTASSNGFSIVSGSQITATTAGVYNIQISLQFEKTDAGTDAVEVWFKKNGTDIANSNTNIQLEGNGAKQLFALNLVEPLTAGQYLEVWWYSADANVQLTSVAAGTRPAIPSAIVTIVPVGA